MSRQNAFHDFGALHFGRRAEFDQAEVQRVHEAVHDSGIRDLYVLVHGAQNDEAVAKAADDAFREMLADAWADASDAAGCLQVRWPSLCFRDEGIPGVAEHETQRERDAFPGISRAMSDDLVRHLPDSASPLAEIAALLSDRPLHEGAFDDLGSALRRLAETPLQDPVTEFAADTEGEVLPQTDPLMLFEDTKTMCSEFAGALSDLTGPVDDKPGEPARHEAGTGDSETPVSRAGTLPEIRVAGHRPATPLSHRVSETGTVAAGGPVGQDRDRQDSADLWRGAHELFRQVVRHVLRRRAGVVGQAGLGPCLAALADASETRIHLVGHGLGGRLAGFALRGLESAGSHSAMLASLTLLQAEMSHFVFADSLPQQVSGHGALWDQRRLVSGPLLCTFSHLDTHLGVMYPLSAQMVGDSAELATMSRKWGALGFDGIQGINGPPTITWNDAEEQDLREMPYTNLDASSLFRSDNVPMGGHHHVVHKEVGRLLRKVAESCAQK
ncbi:MULTISPECIES: hypothetical protein [unclassified Streptomyces]|uniref:hypothetical protein n=1 Tax=unclassified Streptomyces TaxID=2593676 RepID=UPI0033336890